MSQDKKSEDKEPLRKKFAKKARHGALGALVTLGGFTAMTAGVGYGAWYGMTDLTAEPWDYASAETRDVKYSALVNEFSNLKVLNNKLDTLKDQRNEAFGQDDGASLKSLTQEMTKTKASLRGALPAYMNHLVTARGIDEKDYLFLAQELNENDLIKYTGREMLTDWEEASARQECALMPANTTANQIEICMDDKDSWVPEILSVVAGFIGLLFVSGGVNPNPVPKSWERLPNKPRGGSGSSGSIKGKIRQKIPGLRPKRPGN